MGKSAGSFKLVGPRAQKTYRLHSERTLPPPKNSTLWFYYALPNKPNIFNILANAIMTNA